MVYYLPTEPSDPQERQRLAMPSLVHYEECRRAKKRNCMDSTCPRYEICDMAKPYMDYARRRAIPHYYDVPSVSNTNPRRESKRH